MDDKWHSNVSNYGRVEVHEAFAGVDLILRSRTESNRVFEFDFRVKADPPLATRPG